MMEKSSIIELTHILGWFPFIWTNIDIKKGPSAYHHHVYFILQHDLDLNITCGSPFREGFRVIALILSLPLSFGFSFHFFFHNLQIRLLMTYAAAIKVTHTARGPVCHQNSRLENKCVRSHTQESTHILPSAWTCSVNKKSITLLDLHHTAEGKYYEGRIDQKELYFFGDKSLFWLTGLGLLIMPVDKSFQIKFCMVWQLNK